jgi:PTH1 family peptidyl-tRNA hydrolase
MTHIIVGLGNPGEEYEMSRHNAGRIMLERFRKKSDLPSWEKSSNAKALYSSIKIGRHFIELILPETFMNKSGFSVSYAQKKHKIKPENIVVVYDDIDLPFGSVKVAFGRGSGGHRGLESIIRSIKTKDFVRIRIGVAPTTPSGKMKKPKGEKKILDFLMGDFGKKEKEIIPKISKTINEILETIVKEGRVTAMNTFN